MSTPSRRGGTRPPVPTAARGQALRGAFGSKFLAMQAVFLLFLLIASIDEPPSPYNRASASTQMAMVAYGWVVTDVATLTVRAIRVRGQRR